MRRQGGDVARLEEVGRTFIHSRIASSKSRPFDNDDRTVLCLKKMEEEERERLSGQSNVLRQELKTWEREFAAANGGRKAGRDDIKQHPAIGTVQF